LYEYEHEPVKLGTRDEIIKKFLFKKKYVTRKLRREHLWRKQNNSYVQSLYMNSRPRCS